MRSKRRCLKSSNLYLILDKGSLKSGDPLKIAQAALSGGVDIIQLRDKISCARDIIKYGRRLKGISEKRGSLLIINDRVDICQIIDADGVHLGQGDISLKEARSILGKDSFFGVSCHNIDEAIKADKEGADYIAIGPIFKSPTKPELKPKGVKFLKEVGVRVRSPIVAIGGINERNVARVVKSGADVVAVASAVLREKDVKKAVSSLKEEIIRSKVAKK